jgi:hypothetical protein
LQPYLKYHNPRTFEDMDKPIPNFKKFGLKSGAPDGEGGGGGGGARGKHGPGLVVRGVVTAGCTGGGRSEVDGMVKAGSRGGRGRTVCMAALAGRGVDS